MKLEIKVPVRPYVRNFLIHYAGPEPIDVTLRSSCLVVDKIHDLLSRPDRKLYGRKPPSFMKEFTETILLDLGPQKLSCYGFDLTAEKILHFNNFIDKLIRDRLYLLLDSMLAIEPRANISKTIRNFMRSYDLEEAGLNYYTLLKGYERYRDKRPLLDLDVMAFKKSTKKNSPAAFNNAA